MTLLFSDVERTTFVNNIRNAPGPLSSLIKFKLIALDDTLCCIEKRFVKKDPFFEKYMNDNDAMIWFNIKGDILLQFINFFEYGNLRINLSMIQEFLRAADIFQLKKLVLMISYKIWNEGIPFIHQSIQFYVALGYATHNQLSFLLEKLNEKYPLTNDTSTSTSSLVSSDDSNKSSPIISDDNLFLQNNQPTAPSSPSSMSSSDQSTLSLSISESSVPKNKLTLTLQIANNSGSSTSPDQVSSSSDVNSKNIEVHSTPRRSKRILKLTKEVIKTKAPAKSKNDNEESLIYKKQKLKNVSEDDVIILNGGNNSLSTSTSAGMSGNNGPNSPDLNIANSLNKSECNSQSSSSPSLSTLKKRKCVNKTRRNRVKVPEDLKCRICNKIFANSQKYRVHSYYAHKRVNCTNCNKSIGKQYISYHKRVYCKKTEINVKIRKAKKSVKPDSQNKIGSIKGKFDCSYCSKIFKNYNQLEVHERIHIGLKPFKCNFCPFRCNQIGNLANHERTHTKERPFECESCNYTANQSAILKQHVNLHLDFKDYPCKICKEEFTQLSSLNWHKDRHHKV